LSDPLNLISCQQICTEIFGLFENVFVSRGTSGLPPTPRRPSIYLLVPATATSPALSTRRGTTTFCRGSGVSSKVSKIQWEAFYLFIANFFAKQIIGGAKELVVLL